MPGITIERPKMTRVMYQALKKHIVRGRERKKQEQEHDKAMERQRKERELRKKKEEEDSLTLEQTKEQISQLETRLDSLRGEKHELFSQLKKVLHQEDESRKRAQIKEHSEIIQQQYSMAAAAHHPMFLQAHMQPRPSKFMTVPNMHQPTQAVKRSHSPSPPPPSNMYQHYSGGKYPTTTAYSHPPIKQEPGIKASNYLSTHVTFAGQSSHSYQPQAHIQPPQHPPILPQRPPQTSQQAPPSQPSSSGPQHQSQPTQQHQAPPTQHKAPPTQHQALPTQHQPTAAQHQAPPHPHQAPPSQHQAPPTQPSPMQGSQSGQGGKYPSGQSAFQSYSTHFAHQQKQMTERMPQQGYPVQRVPQPGFIAPPPGHSSSSLSLQQQLEHANQKSGFSEEKFKIQQQPIRGVAPLSSQQAQMMAAGQIPSSQPSPQQAPPKGSIVTGYPVRTQASSSGSYQLGSSQSAHSPHASAQRHNYPSQSHQRFYQ